MTEEFRKNKWNGLFISSYFDEFVEEKMAAHLFKSSLEEDVDRAIKASGLLERLDAVCEELVTLRQKRKKLHSFQDSDAHVFLKAA